MKKRIDYYDIAKGIGILLVVIGHVKLKKYPYIQNFIYSFHMPLFFIISGYFFRPKENRECLQKIIKRYIIPYLITCAIIIMYNVIRPLIDGKSFSEIHIIAKEWLKAALYGSGRRREWGIKPIGAIWFLLALSFSTYFMNYIYKFKKRYIISILIAYIGYKTSQIIWLPWSIQAGMFSLIYFEIGIKAKEYNIFERRMPIFIYISSLLLIIFGTLYCEKVYVVENVYKNGFLDIIIACCGTFIVIKVSQLIEKYLKLSKKILLFFGTHSLKCLCIHIISLDCLKWLTVHNFLIKIGIRGVTTRNIIIQVGWVLSILILMEFIKNIIKILKEKLSNNLSISE